ncbi:MAG: fumarylacetoacetate hydrolase family protein [Burkholderiales bacterium]|nr:fumarylacetoacetate hydrolase family protein [Burkholderiales bacterium]ODU68050.1 MAG: fumarylacetoacetate hydrolase [Lautropia sp. SCN 66-9]
MKLASFVIDGRDTFGFQAAPGRVVEWAAAAAAFGLDWRDGPRDMHDFIEAEPARRQGWRELHDRVVAEPGRVPSHDADALHWRAPVRRPSKICCLALNNSANVDRILSGPKHPAIFIKPSSALIGHGEAIELRAAYGRVHPEPELALVIGRRAKNVAAADALDYVFGYTIHNDLTAPTMRGEDTFHYRAIHPKSGDATAIEYVDSHVSYPGRYKCSDTFAALGPWLVTRDEIADPHALDVSCLHQGSLVTHDNTVNLFHKVPQVIEFISHYMTLLPGDVVSMGTALQRSPGGRAVQNVDLTTLGGPVAVTIQGLGTLSNPVRMID